MELNPLGLFSTVLYCIKIFVQRANNHVMPISITNGYKMMCLITLDSELVHTRMPLNVNQLKVFFSIFNVKMIQFRRML